MIDERNKVLKAIDKIIQVLTRILGGDDLRRQIKKHIKKKYSEGIDVAENIFNVNFIPEKKDINYLLDYADEKITKVTDDISSDMKDIIQRGMIDGIDENELKRRVKEEFTDKKYLDRYKMIVRTEGLRAGNKAQLDSVKQLSFRVKKYLDVSVDDRTSDICLEEHEKYGDKSKAIDLDENFVIEVNGKVYEASAPPFHPNCRTVIMFTDV